MATHGTPPEKSEAPAERTSQEFTMGRIEEAVDATPLPPLSPENLATVQHYRLQRDHAMMIADKMVLFTSLKEKYLASLRSLSKAKKDVRLVNWVKDVLLLGAGYLFNEFARDGRATFHRSNLVLLALLALLAIGWYLNRSQARADEVNADAELQEVNSIEW